MLATLLTTHSPIVFDLGTQRQRLCQLVRSGGQTAVAELLITTVDPNVAGHAAIDAAQIGRLLARGRFHGRRAVAIVTPPALSFHAVRLPERALAEPGPEVERAIAWQIAREAHADAEALEVRYWPLPPGHREGLNVMAVAMLASDADRWAALFQEAGLDLVRIEPAPLAMARAIHYVHPPHAAAVWAAVDLGAMRTTLTLFVGHTAVYVRTVSIGARRWLAAISEAFGVDRDEAERILHGTPLQPGFGGHRPTAAGPVATRDAAGLMYRALRESLDTLTHEITRCFSYVLGNYPKAELGGVFLAGGGAQLTGLTAYFEATLDVPINTFDADAEPETRCVVPLDAPLCATAAIGAALLDREGSP